MTSIDMKIASTGVKQYINAKLTATMFNLCEGNFKLMNATDPVEGPAIILPASRYGGLVAVVPMVHGMLPEQCEALTERYFHQLGDLPIGESNLAILKEYATENKCEHYLCGMFGIGKSEREHARVRTYSEIWGYTFQFEGVDVDEAEQYSVIYGT